MLRAGLTYSVEETRAREHEQSELSQKPGTTKPSLYVNRSTPDYFKIVISSNEFSTSFHGGHLKRDSSTQQEGY